MANALYDNARSRLLAGLFDWESDTWQVILVDNGSYTVNLATHEYYSSPQGAVVAGPETLGTPTIVNGAADGDNVTFSGVTGPSIESIILYKFVSVPGDSPLLAYIDQATGLPITPNSGDIIVTWDSGPNRIFKP